MTQPAESNIPERVIEAGAHALLSKWRRQGTAEAIKRQAHTARKQSRSVLEAALAQGWPPPGLAATIALEAAGEVESRPEDER